MYNAERYIGACLQSILGQTFQNYEVIVVNNGSTDNSAAVAESYLQRFGGRLKILHIEFNIGCPSPAHNKGFIQAGGKYVFHMDSDDLIVNNALEILYNFAEATNADVIHMDRKLEFWNDSEKPFPMPEDIRVQSFQANLVEQPVLITESLPNRIQRVCSAFYSWPAWHKFVRRDFLVEHDILFPKLKSSLDVGWTIQIVTCAERLLRIPHPLYIYRINVASVSHEKRSAVEASDYWAEMFVNGIKYFEDWTSKQKFFAENPQYKFMIFDLIARDYLANMRHTITTISVTEYQKLLESKLKRKLGEDSTLTAHLMASSTLLRLQCEGLMRRLFEAENKLQALQQTRGE